jgi:CheY-like chemotaxis protein
MNAQAKTPSLRVLAVDDDPHALQTVVAYLTVDGHTVETATNGREGIDKFKTQQFDLVITNRRMPDMTGEQLATAIKRLNPNMPILMLTALPPRRKPADVNVVLAKPTTLSTFRQAVAKATEKTK